MSVILDMGNDGYKVYCELSVDGDKFCVKPNGVPFPISPCGFGVTVGDAVSDLKSKLRNEMIKRS